MSGWLPAAAIAIYGVCAVALWAEPDWRPEWDSALYFLTARSLAEGEGYRYLGEAFFLRPPGLSWFLSLFPLGVGGDPAFALLNRVFMLSATAGVAAVYVAFRRDYGRGWALVIALLTGTSPIFVDRLNFILTDLPFLALLFLALTSLDRGLRGGRDRWMPTVAGALLLVLAIHLPRLRHQSSFPEIASHALRQELMPCRVRVTIDRRQAVRGFRDPGRRHFLDGEAMHPPHSTEVAPEWIPGPVVVTPCVEDERHLVLVRPVGDLAQRLHRLAWPP